MMRQRFDDTCTDHEIETTNVYELDQGVSIFREEIQNATREIRNQDSKNHRRRTYATDGDDDKGKRQKRKSNHR